MSDILHHDLGADKYQTPKAQKYNPNRKGLRSPADERPDHSGKRSRILGGAALAPRPQSSHAQWPNFTQNISFRAVREYMIRTGGRSPSDPLA